MPSLLNGTFFSHLAVSNRAAAVVPKPPVACMGSGPLDGAVSREKLQPHGKRVCHGLLSGLLFAIRAADYGHIRLQGVAHPDTGIEDHGLDALASRRRRFGRYRFARIV